MNTLILEYLTDNIEELSHKAKRYYHDYIYFNNAAGIKSLLVPTLKARSEFKRALKEYKELYSR